MNNDGITLLMLAVAHENYDACKYLIEKGANVNLQTNYGLTALHYASHRHNYDICVLLVENGADILLGNYIGILPSNCCGNDSSKSKSLYRYFQQLELERKTLNQCFKRGHIETDDDDDNDEE